MWYVQQDMILSPLLCVWDLCACTWKHVMAEKGKSNAGDSRAIICTRGRAIALSQDHKPGNEKETARIEKAGGHVEFGRVNGKCLKSLKRQDLFIISQGNLALSRALGDFEFKANKNLPAEEQAVSGMKISLCWKRSLTRIHV